MARGVTGRQSGDVYVCTTNPSDVLTIQNISFYPETTQSFDTHAELQHAIQSDFEMDSIVNDNNPSTQSKAAIVASVLDSNNKTQHWVRYIKRKPDNGFNGIWSTLRGYKYGKAVITESMPIKPSDLIHEDRFMSTDDLSISIIETLIAHPEIPDNVATIIATAIQNARTGEPAIIHGGAKHATIIEKYAGEYLGPLALIDSGNCGGDTESMKTNMAIESFVGSKVRFPQDKSFELYDSIIELPDGRTINISSKIHNGGGAASSLSGVIKQLSESTRKRFPRGAQLIDILGSKSMNEGPLEAAVLLNIISESDAEFLRNFDRTSQDINDLRDRPVLYEMTSARAVHDNTREDYRCFYHAIAAVVDAVIAVANDMDEFTGAMSETLTRDNFVQLVTRVKRVGDDIMLEYYTKFPPTYSGKPQLYNKTYYATGQKGRIGFKLKL